MAGLELDPLFFSQRGEGGYDIPGHLVTLIFVSGVFYQSILKCTQSTEVVVIVVIFVIVVIIILLSLFSLLL